MRQQVLGDVSGVTGGDELADRLAERHVFLAAEEHAHERREHQGDEEEDAHGHGQCLCGEVDGSSLHSECSDHHLNLEAGDRDGEEVHARGGDGRLAPAGEEQGDDHIAAEEAEGHQEGDPIGEEVRRGRKARSGEVLEGEREGHDGCGHHDGQRLDRSARRAERRREAEQAVGHHQEEGDEPLGHVVVGEHGGVDLQGQRQAAEDGERECDPSRAADPVPDPLQGGERGQKDEFHQRDVGQNLRPVGHRVFPFSAASPPMSPRPAAGRSPNVPGSDLRRDCTPRGYSAGRRSHSLRPRGPACHEAQPAVRDPGVEQILTGRRRRRGPGGLGTVARSTWGGGMARDWARPVVHWEIEATDPERQRAFYADLFNWDIGEGFIMEIPAGIGGPEPGPGGHIRGSERSGVTLYVQVADLRASLDKSVTLGASIVAEPFDVPGGPTLAGITDPEGNPVMLVQA